MNKPRTKTIECYDYRECANYIQYKYGIENLRDVEGHFKSFGVNEEVPYRDFWHFVVDQSDLSNDSIFYMYDEWAEDAEEWQVRILGYFLDEFGSKEEQCESRSIKFYVSW